MLKLEPISKLISQVCSLPTRVLKLPSSLLLVVLLTTGSSLAFAQNTPGSFEDLQLDFDPLQVPVLPSLEPQQGRVLPELEPLELPSASGFEIGPLPAPQLAPDREPASVLELSQRQVSVRVWSLLNRCLIAS